jgi:hypothetical protein
MSALRLVIDNTADERRSNLIDRAVRITADQIFPFGTFTYGIGEVLQKQLDGGDMDEFARDVRLTYEIITSPEYQWIGTARL